MNGNACMSFRRLFALAKGRPWTPEEEREFAALDQPARNEAVKRLAAEAGCVRTEDRRGTDGVVYTAFWADDAPQRACAETKRPG
ncbi:MAG TPA: hypothetical protein VD971_13050 [Phycisphaerales bacterium]|nr:hypothetical protein [Phycisphaerales bacterium]